MELPRLSVIIPNYNHAQYLPQCLEAMLAQSIQPQEILVIDDASTDNSVEVIEDYAARHPRVRLVRNERNQGVLPNINRGLNAATADYVYFAAADDFILPGFFEKSLRLLAEHPQAGLSCTISEWREPSTGLNPHIGVAMGEHPCLLTPTDLVKLERSGRLHIASNSVIYRRTALFNIGGFRPELKWHTDWFALHTLAFRHGVCFVPELLAIFVLHSAGYSAANPEKQRAHAEVLRCLLQFLEQPEMDDVTPLIRDSGALFVFGLPMLRLVLQSPRHRSYLNAIYLRKSLWHGFKMVVKPRVPAFLGELYYRLSGRRARVPQGNDADAGKHG